MKKPSQSDSEGPRVQRSKSTLLNLYKSATIEDDFDPSPLFGGRARHYSGNTVKSGFSEAISEAVSEPLPERLEFDERHAGSRPVRSRNPTAEASAFADGLPAVEVRTPGTSSSRTKPAQKPRGRTGTLERQAKTAAEPDSEGGEGTRGSSEVWDANATPSSSSEGDKARGSKKRRKWPALAAHRTRSGRVSTVSVARRVSEMERRAGSAGVPPSRKLRVAAAAAFVDISTPKASVDATQDMAAGDAMSADAAAGTPQPTEPTQAGDQAPESG